MGSPKHWACSAQHEVPRQLAQVASDVFRPLSQMGATWLGREGGRLPLSLKGGGLSAISYRLPEPSAQVKSAVLLAGLNAAGVTGSTGTGASNRDHSREKLGSGVA